ncbi:hypothetical protein ABVT39_024529 [Epinephelus coioides]
MFTLLLHGIQGTSHRDLVQYSTSEEDSTSSPSSSSDDGSTVILGVLSSPSSKYLIRSFLGQGVFGKVAKCTKSATKKTVAVKIINNTYKTEALNEAAILKQLTAFDADRYNFVRYFGAFTDREQFCLEFEMLDMSLGNFLDKKPRNCFSVKEIRPILHQMATTLQLLGSLGLVHTDLKLDNIMIVDHVNQPLKVKMIDFGLALHVSKMNSGMEMQALHYRSPEVILGHPCTAAIDMWSLGCIAAELLLGYALYPGSSEYDMLRHMVQTQGQLPLGLLDNGRNTRNFFCSGKLHGRRWRLKTPLEYGQVTSGKSKFNSLDDLKKIRPVCHLSEEDTEAEVKDLDNFLDLLKKMLYLDPSKRISPSLLLEDPFITMSDLSESFPNSFYTKSACEMMEVCRDQSRSSEDMEQDPWLGPQASTSTATPNQSYTPSQVAPAWHSHQEHPLVLEVASAISGSLYIQSPPQPQQLSCSVPKGKATPQHQLPSSVAQSDTGKVSPVRKMKRRFSHRSPESGPTSKKRIRMDLIETQTELHETSKEAPAEASSSTATAKPQRKRTWATFVALHTGFSGSPERKKRKMSLPHDSTIKPQRKRSWATFVASYSGLRTPYTGSPERKKRKTKVMDFLSEAQTEAPSTEAKIKPQRKRTWATFEASYTGLRTPYTGSPERKKRKMKVMDFLSEAQTEAPSTEAKIKPQRKRTWATFEASYTGLRTPYTGSPERKKRKTKVMDFLSEAQTEAPSTEAEIKPQRKRAWATFEASYTGLRTPYTGSPERKKRKMKVMDFLSEAQTEAPSTEAEIKPQRKRTWATFEASPERKKRRMSQSCDSKKAPNDESETQVKKKHHDSDQASSSEAKNPDINDKFVFCHSPVVKRLCCDCSIQDIQTTFNLCRNPDCSSPKRKSRKRKKKLSGDVGQNQTSEEKRKSVRLEIQTAAPPQRKRMKTSLD